MTKHSQDEHATFWMQALPLPRRLNVLVGMGVLPTRLDSFTMDVMTLSKKLQALWIILVCLVLLLV